VEAGQAFYVATELLSSPGVFGLVLAALTAALMSTVDTLITAVAAVVVNDVYKPYVRPQATEAQMMRAARVTSVAVTVFGVVLVPLFMMFDSIYEAHGAFTAAVTPPLVVALLMSVFWRRFTATAALWTIVGGLIAIGISLFVPEVIKPFAQGVPMKDAGDGIFDGMKQFKYMRAFFGLVVCSTIGVVVTLLTKPETEERQKGLVWGTIADAIKRYKGSAGSEHEVVEAMAKVDLLEEEPELCGEARLAGVTISRALADDLGAACGDLVYVSDARKWLGGLRSSHAVVIAVSEGEGEPMITLGSDTYETVVVSKRAEKAVLVRRLY
jgi:SSS family solute:Na+ symporter